MKERKCEKLLLDETLVLSDIMTLSNKSHVFKDFLMPDMVLLYYQFINLMENIFESSFILP
jgi:glutamate synthase domain-containing protein 1